MGSPLTCSTSAFNVVASPPRVKPPVFSRNLDEDVARGAAMLGAKEGTDLDPRTALAMMPKPADVCAHGLGITARD